MIFTGSNAYLLRMYSDEMRHAMTSLARASRWHAPDSPEVQAARRLLVTVKMAQAQAEVDRLQAELDRLRAASCGEQPFDWATQADAEACGAAHLCGGPNCTAECGPAMDVPDEMADA